MISQNDRLMTAVADCDLQGVRDCLANGADPNYCNDPDDKFGALQPTRPISLVMFRISDCMLTVENVENFGRIANELLSAGADPNPGVAIAESRYGPFTQDCSEKATDDFQIAFYGVYELVVTQAKELGTK